MHDVKTLTLVGGVLAVLAAATTVGQRLKFQSDIGLNPALVESFNLRIRAWWLMCTVLAAAFLLGPASRVATVVLFGLIGVNGVAVWTWNVPTDASLSGLSFFNQAFSLDPLANTLGLATSNGAVGSIGS